MQQPRRVAAAGNGDGPERTIQVMRQLGLGRSFGCGGLVVVGVILVVLFFSSTTRVNAGEACAVTRFGAVIGQAGPGLHLRIPGVNQFNCFRTASTFYEVLENASGSGADFLDPPVDGVTNDGQPVDVTFSVRYRIPPENVGNIYATIGRTMAEVNERVVKFHSRTITRQQAQRYSATNLYSGDLGRISEDIATLLRPRFEASGVSLEYFELKRPQFQPSYEEAIEQQQIAKEEIETRANEAAAAAEEAKRLEALAQGEANSERIRAEGEAEAIRLRGEAARANPEIIALNYIEALKTINWAILDSGSVNQFLPLQPPTGGSAPPAAEPTSTPLPTPPASS